MKIRESAEVFYLDCSVGILSRWVADESYKNAGSCVTVVRCA